MNRKWAFPYGIPIYSHFKLEKNVKHRLPTSIQNVCMYAAIECKEALMFWSKLKLSYNNKYRISLCSKAIFNKTTLNNENHLAAKLLFSISKPLHCYGFIGHAKDKWLKEIPSRLSWYSSYATLKMRISQLIAAATATWLQISTMLVLTFKMPLMRAHEIHFSIISDHDLAFFY